MVLGEMGEERGRETRYHRFDLILPLFLIFFNPPFIYSAFALVNYYHINSDRGRIAKREGDCFSGAVSLKAGK